MNAAVASADFVPAPYATATGAPIRTELAPAPALKRVFACVIDWLLWAGVGLTFTVIGGLVGLPFSGLFDAAVSVGLAIGSMLGGLGFWALQIYLLSTTGQTVAKRWYGLRVVRTDGRPAGFVHGWLLRGALLRVIDSVTCLLFFPYVIFWVVNVCTLGSKHGRTLHDRLAGTRVVTTTADA